MQLTRHHDSPENTIALLQRVIELSIDHIDMAQFYGNGFVNETIRKAIGKAKSLVIASKVGAAPNPGGPTCSTASAAVEDNGLDFNR
jgi:pyridoxine 4-dehydrogenase